MAARRSLSQAKPAAAAAAEAASTTAAATGMPLQQPDDAAGSQYDDFPMFLDPEPSSHQGSVRTPADLSQDPSAAAFGPEASGNSQHLLPNLLLTEQEQDELISEELSRVNSASCLKDLALNPSTHGGSSGLNHSFTGSWSSLAGVPGSPVAKAMFSDYHLPTTPKTCCHSNLRVVASRQQLQWQQQGGGSGGSSNSSSAHSQASGWAGGELGNSYSESFAAVEAAAAAAAVGSAVPRRAAGSSAAAAAAREEDESLLAEMDACLGSLQAAVKLARSDSKGKVRLQSASASLAVTASAAAAAARAASGAGSLSCGSCSVNGSTARGAGSAPGGSVLAGSARCTRQQSKSRLRQTLDSLSGSSSGRSSDGLVLLKIGSRGRAVAISDPGSPSSSRIRQQQQQQQRHVEWAQRSLDEDTVLQVQPAASGDGSVRLRQLQALQQQQQQRQPNTRSSSSPTVSSQATQEVGVLHWFKRHMGGSSKPATSQAGSSSSSSGSAGGVRETSSRIEALLLAPKPMPPQQQQSSNGGRNVRVLSSIGSSSTGSSGSDDGLPGTPAVFFAPQPPSASRPLAAAPSPRPSGAGLRVSIPKLADAA